MEVRQKHSRSVIKKGTLSVKQLSEPTFYYFAYGSCMCPVDLKRTFGESTHNYVVDVAVLPNYRLGFYRRSAKRNCGVLDVTPEPRQHVYGVLYEIPQRLSNRLDEREEVPTGGYRREIVQVQDSQGNTYDNVRTYTVVNKLPHEIAPNDWYFDVVLRGALTCGLPEEYCWQLFQHMHQLQKQQFQYQKRSA
ncbi:gamma-glutamylcyclotransferase [Geitlerinema sp. PCC 9228]|jgi:cation transport regulator ChaC|uniref:gamma-glutamylcyclotransferase n=1 Tax=Geitlerinema sp. PCC 9228 TaxID=111611 RepID=UPI0008F9D968|nr:gamma-glutamylcyclotransferase [Geitlerinema sp. PCC 9228]